MKKNVWIVILKTVVYAATLALGFLGVNSLVSCSVQHSVSSVGKATIVTVDTTVVNHDGFLKFKK